MRVCIYIYKNIHAHMWTNIYTKYFWNDPRESVTCKNYWENWLSRGLT